MIRSYPKLGSDRLDNARFVSAENIDVDLPLCEPLDEFLSSGSQSVDETKDGNGFPFERHSKNCPRFTAQRKDSVVVSEIQPSTVPAP